jgi:hypothetical protein
VSSQRIVVLLSVCLKYRQLRMKRIARPKKPDTRTNRAVQLGNKRNRSHREGRSACAYLLTSRGETASQHDATRAFLRRLHVKEERRNRYARADVVGIGLDRNVPVRYEMSV